MKVTPKDLRALGKRDPKLGAFLARVEPFPDFPSGRDRRCSHYEALARSITFQQLSTKAATTIWGRVCSLGEKAHFPQATELLSLPEAQLRGAGLSHNKMLALHDLAERSLDGRLRLRGLGRLDNEQVIEQLVEVRGIGVWTAQMFLMFKLGRLDVMAPGDLGLQEGLRVLDGLEQRPTPAQLEERARLWSPLRSVASWTLWRLLELEKSKDS